MPPQMKTDELLHYILEGRRHGLVKQVQSWVQESRRFRAFAEMYRDKIRKKLRNASHDDSLRDLLFELEVALLLLQDSRLNVIYEPYNAHKGRSPDFAVTFTTRLTFHVEATRLRGLTDLTSLQAEQYDSILQNKLMDMTCDKIGQMMPGEINVLAVTGGTISTEQVNAAMMMLRRMAEQKQETFFTGRRFDDARDFLGQFRYLSGILIRSYAGDKPATSALWSNNLAKRPLPKELITLMQTLRLPPE